jgi:tetratricopeptide (TPR) repeat protein
MAMDSFVTYMNEDLGQALRIAGNLHVRGEELNLSEVADSLVFFCVIRPLLYRGRYDDALKWGENAPSIRALGFVYQHELIKATQTLHEMLNSRPRIGTPDDYSFYGVDVVWLEAAVLVGHRKACGLLMHQLAGRSPKTTGYLLLTCIPRHLGGAAALLERYDEARKYYQEAIKVCTEMKFRPELALTRLQLAELLLEHYPQEKSEAVAHLDFAIAEFRDMKMNTYLERALRHKEILKA